MVNWTASRSKTSQTSINIISNRTGFTGRMTLVTHRIYIINIIYISFKFFRYLNLKKNIYILNQKKYFPSNK
jgi:hypothetical protein